MTKIKNCYRFKQNEFTQNKNKIVHANDSKLVMNKL